MKKVLISMLVLSSLVTMVGCNDKKTGDVSSNPVQNEEVSNDNESKGKSNKEMYKIHEELLPKVKEYYESLGADIKEEGDDRAKDYDDITYISHIDYDNNNNGEYTALDYGLSFSPDGKINFLMGGMYMKIDKSFYKDGNFKFEETPFYELSKIFGAGDLDYTGINEKVNDYFNGNGSSLVERSEGQFAERINLSQGEFAYIINIRP